MQNSISVFILWDLFSLWYVSTFFFFVFFIQLSLDQAFRDIRARDEEIRQLRLELAGRDATIDENNQKIREHETMRRKLHNTIQELKVLTILVYLIYSLFNANFTY